MKRTVVLLLAACLLLCACTPRAEIKENGVVVNKTDGTEYKLCGNGKGVFCRRGYHDELYMKDTEDAGYYEISGLDPKDYICDYYSDGEEELARVLHSSAAPDITMKNFEPSGGKVFIEGYYSQWIDEFLPADEYLNAYFSDEFVEEIIANRNAARRAAAEAGEEYIESYEYVYAIRDTILNDEVKLDRAPTPEMMDRECTFHVRLLSEKYRSIYYEVVFWRSIDGVNYLLDRTTDCSYLCPYFVAEYFVGDM